MAEPTRNVLILGSGCAGYTAALYAARGGLEPLLVEGPQAGGLLTLTTLVENYPGFPEGIQGPELMERMREQAKRFDAEMVTATVHRVDLARRPFRVESDGGAWLARTLIVATGSSPRMLGLPAEAKLLGHGVSTCATCDGPFFRGQRVAVVGGGDSAMEEALYLSQLASEVKVIHRRGALRASKIMQTRALENKKIRFEWNQVTEDILDVSEQKVTAIRTRNVLSGEIRDLPVEGVFVAIGHVPNTAFLGDQLEKDEKGYIKTGPCTSETTVRGVFAAGDVQDAFYRQAVSAAGSGCMAAIDANRFLTEEGL